MCQAHEICLPNHFSPETKSQNMLLHSKKAGIEGTGFSVFEKFSFFHERNFCHAMFCNMAKEVNLCLEHMLHLCEAMLAHFARTYQRKTIFGKFTTSLTYCNGQRRNCACMHGNS